MDGIGRIGDGPDGICFQVDDARHALVADPQSGRRKNLAIEQEVETGVVELWNDVMSSDPVIAPGVF